MSIQTVDTATRKKPTTKNGGYNKSFKHRQEHTPLEREITDNQHTETLSKTNIKGSTEFIRHATMTKSLTAGWHTNNQNHPNPHALRTGSTS